MHLGNIWISLLSYYSAKKEGGKFLLRIEDIDLQRSKQVYKEGILYDLEWLGFTWDEGPYYQSDRYDIYRDITNCLEQEEKVYPCYCNRARLQEISSAPHGHEEVHLYDGYCRYMAHGSENKEYIKDPSFRIKVYDTELCFVDLWQGKQEKKLRAGLDDFVMVRSDHMIAYNLAVVVDDAQMGVTEVVRGCDLLDVTFQQIWLYEMLGYKVPQYKHAPLLIDKEGYRLSKRQKSITVKELREGGYTAGMVWRELCEKTKLIEEWKESANSTKTMSIQKPQNLLEVPIRQEVLETTMIVV